MRIIRASEIGTFVFCHRAWWYNLQGFSPENVEEIEAGILVHTKHNQLISQVRNLRRLSYLILFIAVLIALIFLVVFLLK